MTDTKAIIEHAFEHKTDSDVLKSPELRHAVADTLSSFIAVNCESRVRQAKTGSFMNG